jgi:hypothetical protein
VHDGIWSEYGSVCGYLHVSLHVHYLLTDILAFVLSSGWFVKQLDKSLVTVPTYITIDKCHQNPMFLASQLHVVANLPT